MLIAGAARNIKSPVQNVDDDVMTPLITRFYDFNMKYSDDESIKGDVMVKAMGTAGLIKKEQSATRKNEFLMAIANPIMSQIMGPKNMSYLLREIARAHDLKLPDDASWEISDTIPEILAQNMNNASNQGSGQAAAGGSPTKPQSLNAAGDEMGSSGMQRV
jgi:hypothetical protein